MKSGVLKRLERIAAKRDKVKVSNKYKVPFPNLKCRDEPHKLSNAIDGKCFKRDKLFEHRWKKGAEETPATVKAIETKAKRIRPLISKGAYGYATDGDNSGPIRIHQKAG